MTLTYMTTDHFRQTCAEMVYVTDSNKLTKYFYVVSYFDQK